MVQLANNTKPRGVRALAIRHSQGKRRVIGIEFPAALHSQDVTLAEAHAALATQLTGLCAS